MAKLAWAGTFLGRSVQWEIEPLDEVRTVRRRASAQDGTDGADGLVVEALAGWLSVDWVVRVPVVVSGGRLEIVTMSSNVFELLVL